MKLALALASFFGLTFTLVRGGAIYHRAIPDFSGCQSLPTVLDNTTVTFENFTISYLSLNCPLVSCNTTKRATIEQRDPICATGATCTVDCTSLGDTPIDTADCTPIIQFLESMDPTANFTIPAQTFDIYYLNTCAVSFWNYDCTDYTACFSDFGTNAQNVETTCEGVSNGGYCAGADTPGEEWVVGITPGMG